MSQYKKLSSIQRKVAEQLFQHLAQELKDSPPSSWLDMGCGTGQCYEAWHKIWSMDKKDHPSILVMMDSAYPMVRDLPFPCYAVVADMNAPAVRFDFFDLITMNMSLHWSSDGKAALCRLAKSLKRGGLLALSMPFYGNWSSWRELLRGNSMIEALQPLPHSAQLDEWLETAGLESVHKSDSIHDEHFASARAFVRTLHLTGVHTARSGYRGSSYKERASLLKEHHHPVTIDWKIAYRVVRRR